MASYPILCSRCEIVIDSYESFEKSGERFDEHTKAKHPETIETEDEAERVGGYGDAGRYRFNGPV